MIGREIFSPIILLVSRQVILINPTQRRSVVLADKFIVVDTFSVCSGIRERMTDNEDGEGTNTRKNDWEVVSLTASAYETSPGPDEVQGTQVNSEDETETSRPLFMSDHFVFPPSQHENLPLEPEDNELPEQQQGNDETTELDLEESKSSLKNEKYPLFDTVNEESAEQHFFDEKGVNVSTHKLELEEARHCTATDSSLDETSIGGPSFEEAEESEGNSYMREDLSNLSNPINEDDGFCESESPPGAWWKKGAASLYTHAKDANALWSICIAAAVMGLVILGQRWQQEKWQVLHSKWHLTLKDEKVGRMLVPIHRIKDVILGGQRRSLFIRSSPSGEN